MKNPIIKMLLIFFSFFIIVSLACAPFTQEDPTATPPPPVVLVEPEVQEEVIEEPTATPTEVIIFTPTFTQQPTREVPPTATMEPVIVEEVYDEPLDYFIEEFDGDINSWSYFLMSGVEDFIVPFTENSRLVFDLRDQYQWVYVLYDEYIYENVRIDMEAENLGKNTNNVSLICNYSDRLGWYEFNISNGGLYWIYVYSELDGDYYTLASGGSTHVRMGRDVNTYTAICEGNKLELYINGYLERQHTDTKYNLREGQVGLGVSSFDVLPILVEIDYFSISVP